MRKRLDASPATMAALNLHQRFLLLFVPLLVVAVTLTTVFIIGNAEAQRQQSAFVQINDDVTNARATLDERLYAILRQVIRLEYEEDFQRLLLSRYLEPGERDYYDYLDVDRALKEARRESFQEFAWLGVGVGGLVYGDAPALPTPDQPAAGYGWSLVARASGADALGTLSKSYLGAGGLPFGTYAAGIRADYLLSALRGAVTVPGAVMVLSDGRIGAEPSGTLTEDDLRTINRFVADAETTEGPAALELSGLPWYLTHQRLTINDWQLVAVVPQSAVVSLQPASYYSGLVLVVCALAAMIAVAVLLARQLSHSLRELSTQAAALGSAPLDRRFRTSGPQEALALAEALNSLLDSRGELMRRVQVEERLKREADLLALQEQMRPHFLYNALSAVVFLSDSGENEEASVLTRRLIDFLRAAAVRGEEVVPIARELDHVRNYLDIQQVRFGNRVVADIVLSDVGAAVIPSFTIQPVVENVFAHAVEGAARPVRVRLEVVGGPEGVVITVEDDGGGMGAAELRAVQQAIASAAAPASSLALWNVARRLKLRFGELAQLTVDSVQGAGTTVTLRVPGAAAPPDSERSG